jgi:hypothetical protein
MGMESFGVLLFLMDVAKSYNVMLLFSYPDVDYS